MSKLSQLKKQASAWARANHHELGEWADYTHWGGPASTAHCIHCHRWVQVHTTPAPNSIDVGGTIAEDCTGG